MKYRTKIIKKIYLLFLSINLLLVSCVTQTIGQKIEKEQTINFKEKDSRIASHFNNLNKMLMKLKINGQNVLDYMKKIERYTSPE
tara:strand:+ start:326 stop:580 length:255 start_codon:yes stop_codon:yes gene_type:complete